MLVPAAEHRRVLLGCWNYRSLNLVIAVFMFGFVYVKQYLDCHMLEVTMRLWQLRCPTLESVIDSDMCGVESIKMLYFLFIFESYFGLIHGWRSSTRLPLPLSRFPHGECQRNLQSRLSDSRFGHDIQQSPHASVFNLKLHFNLSPSNNCTTVIGFVGKNLMNRFSCIKYRYPLENPLNSARVEWNWLRYFRMSWMDLPIQTQEELDTVA